MDKWREGALVGIVIKEWVGTGVLGGFGSLVIRCIKYRKDLGL
jgi:hypothetical protein